MLKQQNNIVWSLISLNNAHAMSWKVHCFIQQYLLFALNEALCQFLSKFDIYPISIWRNFFQFEFVRNFVYSIFYYLTSTGLYEQNFLCYRSHIGSSLKVPGLTHCAPPPPNSGNLVLFFPDVKTTFYAYDRKKVPMMIMIIAMIIMIVMMVILMIMIN